MLSGAAAPFRLGRGSWRITALAGRPTARALPWLTIGPVLAMAAVPSVVVLLRGAGDFSGAVTGALLLGGATAGYFVEDAAGETLSASPTSLARRRGLRLTAIALAAALTFAAIVAMTVVRGPIAELSLGARAAELLAVAGMAAGTAGLVHRSGGTAPGPTGALAGPMGALVLSALAVRLPALPTLASPAHHDRWWIIAVVSWVVAAWTSRD